MYIRMNVWWNQHFGLAFWLLFLFLAVPVCLHGFTQSMRKCFGLQKKKLVFSSGDGEEACLLACVMGIAGQVKGTRMAYMCRWDDLRLMVLTSTFKKPWRAPHGAVATNPASCNKSQLHQQQQQRHNRTLPSR